MAEEKVVVLAPSTEEAAAVEPPLSYVNLTPLWC